MLTQMRSIVSLAIAAHESSAHQFVFSPAVMVSGEADVTQSERVCPAGLAPRRELHEGWNGAAGARRRLKSFEIQFRQNASAEQMDTILEELFECLELDFQMCQVKSCSLQNAAAIKSLLTPCCTSIT